MSESEKERVGLNKFIKIGGEKVSLYIRRKKNHKSFQISIYNAHNKTQYIVLKITYFHFLLSYFQFEGKLKLELHVINIKICGVLSGVPENDLHIPCKQQDTIIAKRQLHDYFMGIYMYEENMSKVHTDL